MSYTATDISYLDGIGTKLKRSIRRDNVSNRDSFEMFAPELESKIDGVVGDSRTAAQSISVTTCIDKPLEISKSRFLGNDDTQIATSNAANNNLIIDVSKFEVFTIQFTNGGTALSSMEILSRCHESGSATFQSRYNSSANYSSLSGFLKSCTGVNGAFLNPFSLAANGSVWLAFDFRDTFVSHLNFKLTTASGSSTYTYFWGSR